MRRVATWVRIEESSLVRLGRNSLKFASLVHRGGVIQIDLFPFTPNNSSPNLGRGLTSLVLLIGVIELLQAGCAPGSVSIFVTAVQAVVAHAVAVTVAGLLMEHDRNLSRKFV